MRYCVDNDTVFQLRKNLFGLFLLCSTGGPFLKEKEEGYLDIDIMAVYDYSREITLKYRGQGRHTSHYRRKSTQQNGGEIASQLKRTEK